MSAGRTAADAAVRAGGMTVARLSMRTTDLGDEGFVWV